MKIISYCLFGKTPLYNQGAIENVKYAKKIYPEWTCRFYCHKDVPMGCINKLTELGAEVLIVDDPKADINKFWVKFWRFYPCEDPKIKYVIVRDTDSRPSYKEREAVYEWIKSGKNFNILHDSEAHGAIIPAGMWGAKGGVIKNMKGLINSYLTRELKGDPKGCLWNSDQIFLTLYVWPLAKQSYTAFGTSKNVKKRFPDFISYPYPKHQGFLYPNERFIGQKIFMKALFAKSKNIINVYHIEINSGKKTWVSHRLLGMLQRIEKSDNKIHIVKNILAANVVIGSYEASIFKFIDSSRDKYDLRNKKFLVWCLEPRWSLSKSDEIDYQEFKIHIMNCYTKNVYVSPLQFCHAFKFKHFNPIKMNKKKFHRKIVVISTAKRVTKPAQIEKLKDRDLTNLRYDTAILAYNTDKKSIDIYGKKWPPGVSKTYDGSIKQVYKQKLDILSRYYFNLCTENTNCENYVSEKIWHSIISGCLPLYYGNESIYQIFPKKSFIDFNDYPSPKQMLEHIKNMTYREFITRFNRCYDAVKNIKKTDLGKCTGISQNMLADKIKYIAGLDNAKY